VSKNELPNWLFPMVPDVVDRDLRVLAVCVDANLVCRDRVALDMDIVRLKDQYSRGIERSHAACLLDGTETRTRFCWNGIRLLKVRWNGLRKHIYMTSPLRHGDGQCSKSCRDGSGLGLQRDVGSH
jgi:hypothetical protein